MRGKPVFRSREPNPSGITPADAGKTRNRAIRSDGKQDHPRGCGENKKYFSLDMNELGSPPRMRGKLVYVDIRQAAVRITPADAGKTFAIAAAWRQIEDHPRGCGENSVRFWQAHDPAGSPPRMRGKPMK